MEDLYEKIADYNLGQLSPAEMAQMEQAMAADPKLEKAVLLHRAEWEARELLAEKILRSQIRQQFEAQPTNGPASWFSSNRIWLLPVAGLLLLGAAWLLWKNSQPYPTLEPTTTPAQNQPAQSPYVPDTTGQTPPNEPARPIAGREQQAEPDWSALAAASYLAPESLNGLRGQDGDTLAQALSAFSEKKYQQAVQLLSNLPEASQQEALSVRAHAQFLSKNYGAAVRDFSALEAGGIYRRDAQWFGLLARLATGKFDKAQLAKDLGAIRTNEKHPYKIDAEALYQKSAEALKMKGG